MLFMLVYCSSYKRKRKKTKNGVYTGVRATVITSPEGLDLDCLPNRRETPVHPLTRRGANQTRLLRASSTWVLNLSKGSDQ